LNAILLPPRFPPPPRPPLFPLLTQPLLSWKVPFFSGLFFLSQGTDSTSFDPSSLKALWIQLFAQQHGSGAQLLPPPGRGVFSQSYDLILRFSFPLHVEALDSSIFSSPPRPRRRKVLFLFSLSTLFPCTTPPHVTPLRASSQDISFSKFFFVPDRLFPTFFFFHLPFLGCPLPFQDFSKTRTFPSVPFLVPHGSALESGPPLSRLFPAEFQPRS